MSRFFMCNFVCNFGTKPLHTRYNLMHTDTSTLLYKAAESIARVKKNPASFESQRMRDWWR